ncbi:actin depolymerization factor/cofilin-like domain-containing protein [Streptomyces sp. NPDC046161]|uniref:actin-binding ADF family protein n=1 Tax=Streptomyces sp. NPDC046161 TaxID=3155132 RepID=UPI0033C17E37
MTTGDDASYNACNDLKRGQYTYLIFKVRDEKELVVEAAGTDSDHEAFVSYLPQDDCRYAVYNHDTGERKKLAFSTWSPDAATARSKAIYAGTANNLRNSLPLGSAVTIQGTDYDEVSREAVLEKINRS